MTSPRVFGANSLYPCLGSCGRRNFPNTKGFQHTQIGEGVDDRGPAVIFAHLSLDDSGIQAVAELFELVHNFLGKAALVAAAVVLPASATIGGDVFRNGSADVWP